MSTQKRTRRKNIAAESSNQTSNPAVTVAPFLKELRQGIESAISTIDSQYADAPGEYEKILLLTIRQDLSPLMDLIEAEPSTVSAPSSGIQAATPACAALNMAKLNRAISDLIGEIDEAVQHSQSTGEKLRLLMIRQSAEEVQGDTVLLIGAEARAATPEKTAPREPASAIPVTVVDPFPLGEDPEGLMPARYHIRDAYEAALKKEHHDGFSDLIGLANCIQHHPVLKAETDALQMLIEGMDALNRLSTRHFIARESDSDFTGAEVWLANLIGRFDKGLTMGDFIKKLWDIPDRLRVNPKTTALADIVQGMLDGTQTLRKMKRWLESL